jgi:hypothetical protein
LSAFPYKIIESVRLRAATIDFWDNGITNMRIDDNVEVALSDSTEQYELLRARYDGTTKYKILVEPGRYTSISKEAREFSTVPERNAMTAASAVLVRSLAHRIVINFLINFIQKQNMKMRMFDSREKAIEWLLSIKV